MSPVFFWEQIGKIKHKYIDAILSLSFRKLH